MTFGTLREKIAADKQARLADYAKYPNILERAHAQGIVAANNHQPLPMVVQDGRTGKVVDVVADGACGFAWVTVRPATSRFAKWLLKNHGNQWSKAYGGGIHMWVHSFNQSMSRKEAYARAYAEVLRAEGIQAYAESRLD